MLFKKSPDVAYNYSDAVLDPKIYLVKNLWRRNDIIDRYLGDATIFNEYIIKPGETPEIISFNQYDSVFYGWTILVANDKTNYHESWPRSQQALYEYVYAKYDNPDAVMMYETTEVIDALKRKIVPAGLRVPSNYQVTYYDGTASAGVTVNPTEGVTYYQYEQRLNDEKEKIKLIRPSYIREFVSLYTKSLHKGGSLVTGQASFNVKID